MNADINLRFELLARILADVLANHRGLPAPHQITLTRLSVHELDIRLQVHQLDHLAVWANALGVPVHMTEKPDYVSVTATQTVGEDTRLEVWGHMRHSDAWRLLVKHNKTLTYNGVDIDPDAILHDLTDAMMGRRF